MSEFDKYLREEVQEFINSNLNSKLSEIAFKKSPFEDISIKELLDQIESKKKCENKLPTWYSNSNIIYPAKISIEQSTSEVLAKFKSSFFEGKSAVDLSGGIGVDSFYNSKKFDKFIHCELNGNLSKIAEHNFKVLNALNIECYSGDSIEYLNTSKEYFDLIYIDPARRSEGKKVFQFKDTTPNPVEIKDLLLNRSDVLAIKASPLLDIKSSLSDFPEINSVFILSLDSEVKELLLIRDKKNKEKVKIKCVELFSNSDKLQYIDFDIDDRIDIKYSPVKSYLYDPSSSLLKSGAFNQIAKTYQIDKISPNTHLYTSELIKEDFIGRIFIVKEQYSLSSKEFKNFAKGRKINVSLKNFPSKTEDFKKKYKIKDGGNQHLFVLKDIDNKYIALVCDRI